MTDILILHGPNLNLLGLRQPELYGHTTLKQINTQLDEIAKHQGINLDIFQSNSESCLIDKIHQAYTQAQCIIINPAGFTHTSVALLDALLAVRLPYIEVHLSLIHARDTFRKTSLFSEHAMGVITGFGAQSYHLALLAACQHLKKSN